MKDIQEIMIEMENIARKQTAADLSDEEREELLNLINIDTVTPSNVINNLSSFCATPTPSPSPIPTCAPDNACGSQPFCCMIVVPSGLTVDPTETHAAVVTKDLMVTPDGQCTTTIGNCTIILNKAIINGCAQVFVSLGVKDRCGNCTFLSCTDFVCLCEKNIICCVLPQDGNIKFIVSTDNAVQVAIENGCEGQQVWKVTGTLSFTCDNC